MIAASLDPCEALVAFAADNGLSPEYMRQARSWSVEEWEAAAGRLAERGLLDASGALTSDGRALRRWVEDRTDAAAAAPWRALGGERSEQLADLLTPLALTLTEHNESMRINPMALSAPTPRADADPAGA